MPIEWEEYKGEDWKGKKRENEGGTHRNSPNPDIIIAIPPAMPLDITDKGLLLESSHKSMAGLPMQAFAISLSDHDIEDMIASVQNGNRLELSLGSSPTLVLGTQEIRIPNSPDAADYDLYRSNPGAPGVINKLPNPTMSLFTAPRHKTTREIKTVKAKPSSARPASASLPLSQDREGSQEGQVDDAVLSLKNSLAKAEADRRENSALVVDGLSSRKNKNAKPGNRSLLGSQGSGELRSIPVSPSLSGVGSPPVVPTGVSGNDRLKQQRFPIIHELAVQDLTTDELLSRYKEGNAEEFDFALRKVADLDNSTQKWGLKKMYWKELDVFLYDYSPEDRQTAIDNAIKQYDRARLGVSDPLWQKLLPKAERGKGTCLSKLKFNQNNPASQSVGKKTEISSTSGGDSERDDVGSALGQKGNGGEPMSRSGSQTKKKPTASELQARRLLSTSKKVISAPAPAAKRSPKVSPKKSVVKQPVAKVQQQGGRVLSNEFVSDSGSESDSEEQPLAIKVKGGSNNVSRAAERPTEKPKPVPKPRVAEKAKAAEKPRLSEKVKAPERRETPASKAKTIQASRLSVREKQVTRESDTIRAEVVARPVKPAPKRVRDTEEDDSSSSGTPLSKRVKPEAKAEALPAKPKQRAPSDASQHSRGTLSGLSSKSKGTSPVKSSPLASSPPTNASDVERERTVFRGRERVREYDRDTIISSASSNSGSSVGERTGGTTSRKRPVDSSSSEPQAKRPRLTPEILEKATAFKRFYSRYEELHREIAAAQDPEHPKLNNLLDMHHRLAQMKADIYHQVPIATA